MTVSTLTHILIGTDTVETARDFWLFDTLKRFFRTVYYFKMLNLCLTKFLTNHLRQWVVNSLEDVSHTKLCGIKFISSTHTRKQWDVHFVTTIDKIKLSCYSINTINDIIIMREVELIGIIRQIECLIFPHDTAWIDWMNTLFSNIYFMLSHCSRGSKELSIDIR